MTPITERSVSLDDSVDYSDAKEDDEDDYLEERTPVAGVKALARNLAEELAGPAMDSDDDGSDRAKSSAATGKSSTGVFGSKGFPYMHDSHMVTPRSANRRYDLNEDSSDDGKDLLDVDHLEGDLIEEWARQIRELSAKEEKNSTPRIEITTHLQLGNIKPFSGYRNKSEKSMQWL
ncbi:hypothetical protein PHMEG_00039805, partial [Phytophthora megakarya]